jgi:hypothetical protein
MSKLKNSYVNSTILGGQNISVGYTNTGTYVVDINKDLIEYIDFAFQVIGIDLNYQDFKKMSADEKKAFLRDIKINKIL